jgi:hypothetical protein
MSAPVRIDNVTLSDATDFEALVLAVLRGGGGVGARRSDNYPVVWILRAYDALKSSSYAARLARGVAAALTAPEPEVRAQALVFFQAHPDAAAGDRVDDLVAGDRALFAGVADPIHPGTDLDWQLLTALAARVRIGDRRALDLARAEVLLPGKGTPLISELVAADAGWAVARAEEIVRATPAAGASLLIALQGSGHDLAAIGRRIARWCRADARFELDVSRFIDDVAARRAILDAFHALGN